MLRISKLADYGTVIMVYLAKQSPQLCSTRNIAEQTHLTVATVSKLLKKLTVADLLQSVRGTAGGYRLNRSACDISVAEIVYALDKPSGLTECSHQPNDCTLQHVCHVKGNWQLISRAIHLALCSVSLDTLAKPLLGTMSINLTQ